jgi:hypothetical protein
MEDLLIRVNFDDAKSKQDLYESLRNVEGWCMVKVSKIKSQRSISQNRYYWGVVLDYIVKETSGISTDIDKEHIHEVLRYKFLRSEKVDPFTGEVIEYSKSTTSLNTKEFKDYIEQVVHWAYSFLGIEIPAPNEII